MAFAKVVDIADNSTVVTTKPAKLVGAYVNTGLSAHAVPIKSGSDTIVTIPASAAAGASYDFFEAECPEGITVDPNDSGTGGITLMWKY
jgi:hypothetical protein